MLERLNTIPVDPILGLSQAYRADTNPQKVDLGVGVYKNEAGETPILDSVAKASRRVLAQETTKAYQSPAGNPLFNEGIQKLILGNLAASDSICTLQTPGGCGALRVAADLIIRCNPSARIWVSNPTWANHIPLLGNAGLTIAEYPYYSAAHRGLDFDGMMSTLEQVPAGDLVLLHGCCHNPSGTDLSLENWQAIAQLAEKNGFIPFVDIAYQGLGDGLEDDAIGVRYLAENLPEVIIASSCSKNFGLYRERTGAVTLVSSSAQIAQTAFGQLQNVARGTYSMPPAHGGSLVAEILGDAELRASWEGEVGEMRERIWALRAALAEKLAPTADFSFVTRQKGMFSFLGLTPEQVQRLRDEFSVYMVSSSRVNIAGLNAGNIDYAASAIAAVL